MVHTARSGEDPICPNAFLWFFPFYMDSIGIHDEIHKAIYNVGRNIVRIQQCINKLINAEHLRCEVTVLLRPADKPAKWLCDSWRIFHQSLAGLTLSQMLACLKMYVNKSSYDTYKGNMLLNLEEVNSSH